MPLASSQGNSPFLAQLQKKLPATPQDWQAVVNALQAWQRSLTTVKWQAPALLNSWSNFDTHHEPAGFYIDAAGVVHLRGLVKGGGVGSGSPLFSLPTGYQPPFDVVLGSMANGAACELDIAGINTSGVYGATGNVMVATGTSNAWISLHGISFSTSP